MAILYNYNAYVMSYNFDFPWSVNIFNHAWAHADWSALFWTARHLLYKVNNANLIWGNKYVKHEFIHGLFNILFKYYV